MTSRYYHLMDPAEMNDILSEMTPDEIEDTLRFIEVCERGGGTPPEEAAEWRRRILAHSKYLKIEDDVLPTH